MLHVLNGDATFRVFQQACLPGDVLVWRDILVEGPAAPPAVRAPYLAERLGIDAQEYVAGRQEEAAALEGSADHDEVVLWFEQDLFCAVNLWFLLDWSAARDGAAPPLSLVFPDEVPGVGAFRGLGTLESERLPELFARRAHVSDAARALGRRLWSAWASPDPRGLEPLLADETSALPFVGAAVRCHLARFSSVERGVNEVEEAMLSALADEPLPFSPLWRRVSCDPRVRAHGMGDVQFAAHLRELAAGPGALVALEGDAGAFASWRLALTALGRDVLARRRDWLALHPLHRWLGGVHLHPEGAAWRWGAARGRLVGDAR